MKERFALYCALFLVTCSRAQTQAATHTVTFRSNEFDPPTLSVNAGDTVVFKNEGGFHTVTGLSASDPFCGNDRVSEQCSVTFDQPGTYPYRCLFHSTEGPNPTGMTGVITVLAAPADKPNLVP